MRVAVVCLVAVLAACVSAEAQNECRTPSEQPGQCISLQSCEPLARLTRSGYVSSTKDKQLLRDSVCGEIYQEKVCCPLGGEGTTTAGPATSTTRPSRDDSDSSDSAEGDDEGGDGVGERRLRFPGRPGRRPFAALSPSRGPRPTRPVSGSDGFNSMSSPFGSAFGDNFGDAFGSSLLGGNPFESFNSNPFFSDSTTRRPFGSGFSDDRPFGGGFFDNDYTSRRPFGGGSDFTTTRRPYGGSADRDRTTRRPFGGSDDYTTRRPYGGNNDRTTRRPIGGDDDYTTRRPSGGFTTRRPQPNRRPQPQGERGNDLINPEECGLMAGDDRIIGGNRTHVMELPFLARLGYGSSGSRSVSYRCGGSLINSRYVLTAAHCTGGRDDPTQVRLGEWDAESREDCDTVGGNRVCAPAVVDVDVEQVIRHPDYSDNPRSNNYLQNDIALLRLRSPVRFSEAVKPICLPDGSTRLNLDGKKVVVAGWGKDRNRGSSGTRFLMKASVPVVDDRECARVYRERGISLDGDSQICAGGQRGIDSCQGDSGGPLYRPGNMGSLGVRVIQNGVVSFGLQNCATEGVPGVYTRVEHFMPWIRSNMRP